MTDEEATLEAICLEANADVALADRILGAGMLALARFRRGDHSGALAAADVAEAVIETTDQVAHYLLEAYLALAEVYDGLWGDAQSRSGADAAALRRRLVGVVKLVEMYAWGYPIGKPVVLLIRGWIASRDGNPGRAAKLFRRALGEAARLRMPALEEAARRALATRAGTGGAR